MTTTFTAAALVASVVGLAPCAALEPVWKGRTMMGPLEASDAGAAGAVDTAAGEGLDASVE